MVDVYVAEQKFGQDTLTANAVWRSKKNRAKALEMKAMWDEQSPAQRLMSHVKEVGKQSVEVKDESKLMVSTAAFDLKPCEAWIRFLRLCVHYFESLSHLCATYPQAKYTRRGQT